MHCDLLVRGGLEGLVGGGGLREVGEVWENLSIALIQQFSNPSLIQQLCSKSFFF